MSLFEIPELPECPYHGHDPSQPIGGCQICWGRFYIPFEYNPVLRRIEHAINDHVHRVETATRLIALEREGFETRKHPEQPCRVLIALPDGQRVHGRFLSDGMGGLYPAHDNSAETPIGFWAGWRYE